MPGVGFESRPKEGGFFFQRPNQLVAGGFAPSFYATGISILRRFGKIAKKDYRFRHVRLSIRMDKLGSH
jgi:hypothetical protein